MFNDIKADSRGLVAFDVQLNDENSGTYTTEEILSMILKHAKDLAEKQSKSEI